MSHVRFNSASTKVAPFNAEESCRPDDRSRGDSVRLIRNPRTRKNHPATRRADLNQRAGRWCQVWVKIATHVSARHLLGIMRPTAGPLPLISVMSFAPRDKRLTRRTPPVTLNESPLQGHSRALAISRPVRLGVLPNFTGLFLFCFPQNVNANLSELSLS